MLCPITHTFIENKTSRELDCDITFKFPVSL